MSDITYARLRVVDPGRWRAAAVAWRDLAEWTGRRSTDIVPSVVRLREAWSGPAATGAQHRLEALRRRLTAARLAWWEADQALSELAAEVDRARALLAAAVGTAERAGLVVDVDGRIGSPGPPSLATATVARTSTAVAHDPATVVNGLAAVAHDPAAVVDGLAAVAHDPAAVVDGLAAVARDSATALAAALAAAARADATAAGRLAETAAALTAQTAADVALAAHPAADGTTVADGITTPPCGASAVEVRRWWDTLSPAQRRGLVADVPAVIGALDGVPAAFRDLANRLLLDDHRETVDARITGAHGAELRRLHDQQSALHALAERLADGTGPRAYLLRLQVAGEGRAVVALGDPDRSDNVLTHVPGMTAGLASLGGELDRAARVAAHARQVAPQEATSAVLWLDYDAPDSLPEAAGTARAEAGAVSLSRFQDGLRASHDGSPAHLTVAGHSYGSLVVGTAAARAGLAADSVVFVGSPGVGVDTVAGLQVPAGQVWSTTSVSDVVQYAAVSPGGLLADLATSAAIPVLGPALAFGLPEDDLWHGHNPSDRDFGARVFTAQQDAGHLGYWDPGRPALDSLAHITLGGAYQEKVR